MARSFTVKSKDERLAKSRLWTLRRAEAKLDALAVVGSRQSRAAMSVASPGHRPLNSTIRYLQLVIGGVQRVTGCMQRITGYQQRVAGCEQRVTEYQQRVTDCQQPVTACLRAMTAYRTA